MAPPTTHLPIDATIPAILAALDSQPSVVIEAPTGAGKSTRVPPALADALGGDGKIVVVQPRRVAARAVARRIAEERGESPGGEVGYQVRFDRKTSGNTRILVVTDGILLRMLQTDPFLEDVDAICFDEFHERRLNTDLGLALTRRVQQEVRPDLKLIVMSATLDAGPIAEWLGAPRIVSEGRTFPVDIVYEAARGDLSLSGQIVRALRKHSPQIDGDVLVFLPGVGEIRDAHAALRDAFGRDDFEFLELYGDLPPEEQDRVFASGPQRRVVLATNVAETSVTIPGIRLVIDSGLARTMRLDPSTGFDRLRVESISRAEADQRAGRAGRTSAGLAVRLWAAHADRQRDEFPTPEIRRVDIADALLELFAWGEANPLAFPWFEAPDPGRTRHALRLLSEIGLIDDHGLTAVGRMARELPLPPRLAAMLLYGAAAGEAERASYAAALLSERDVFLRSFGDRVGNTGSESDLDDRIRALRGERWSQHLHRGAAHTVRRLQKRLRRDVAKFQREARLEALEIAGYNTAFVRAYPDRIAQRREGSARRAITSAGRGLYLHESSSVARSSLFVALEVVDTDSPHAESLCVKAVGIERNDVPAVLVERAVVCEFVEEHERVEVREEERLGAIILSSRHRPSSDHPDVAERLVAAALTDIDRALDLTEKANQRLVERWRFAARHSDEVPELEESLWRTVLEGMAQQCSSFAELRKRSLPEHLFAAAGWSTRQALDRLAPETLEVPSGNRIRLDYSDPEAPVLPVKIQEMFGATETPRVADGRVPVIVHLLAPNRRPQQVTRDLASFWQNTYPEVRKELRQRYAKHPWPEDPTTAPATAMTKKAYARSHARKGED